MFWNIQQAVFRSAEFWDFLKSRERKTPPHTGEWSDILMGWEYKRIVGRKGTTQSGDIYAHIPEAHSLARTTWVRSRKYLACQWICLDRSLIIEICKSGPISYCRISRFGRHVAAVSSIWIAESQDLGEIYGSFLSIWMNNGGQKTCGNHFIFMVGWVRR
jgi:hypothetical protein